MLLVLLQKQKKYVLPPDLNPSCNTGESGIGQCYFEAFVRKYVFNAWKMTNTLFTPPIALRSKIAPVRNSTGYRYGVLQGEVDDENCYALGGIAGHAGLFSNAEDLYQYMRKWMYATANDIFLNSTTTKLWIKEFNHSQSSRAIGWNTNDPDVFDMGWNQSCGSKFSVQTFTHTGYTGTQLCGDPKNEIFSILLTNRVYPNTENNQIRAVRQMFGNAVADAVNNIKEQLHENQKSGDISIEKLIIK